MPTLKTLDEVAKLRIAVAGRGFVSVSRRTLQQWLTDGKLRGYRIEGNPHRFVDLDEVTKLVQPAVVPPRLPKPKPKP